MSDAPNAGATGPKPFVFVIMPFKDEFKKVYEEGIQPAAIAAGAHAERLDEQIYTSSMYGRLVNQIAKADLIVADVSEENPNVFYEVGYAHALNKEVFLVTNGSGKFHFDVQDRRHIVYRDGLAYLKQELTRSLTWAIRNPSHSKPSPSPCPLEVMLNGIAIPESGTNSPLGIPLNSEPWDNGDLVSRSSIQIRNLFTGRIVVDRVYWLSCEGQSVVPMSGNVRRAPSHVPHRYGDYGPPFRYRFQVSKNELVLPAYDTESIEVMLWQRKGRLVGSPYAIEVLANDRSYRFEFIPIG